MTPRATYRLQLSGAFTLADATAVVPYLARLGISHLYCSPLLAARRGSTHGYDLVDHGRINPELGGMPAFLELVAALRRQGLGLLLDIVPNHMGVAGAENRLWLDVLERGRASPYAGWFDIEWEAEEPLAGRILLPVLGQPYGSVLERGGIALRFDPAEGSLSAWYHEHRFPIAQRDYAAVLAGGGGDIEALLASPPAGGRRASEAWRHRLAACAATADGARGVAAALARFDAADAAGRQRLHGLLERQHYRLAWWRAAADEVNYRRFFNINELAGFRVEVPAAFEAAHGFVLDLWRRGLIDGLRIDHVDGLAEPRAYCRKLRRRMEALAGERPEGLSRRPWIVVEKILARHETLTADWRADGSTGYDFMDAVGGLLHDPAGEAVLDRLHAELAGGRRSFHEEEVAARRQVLRDQFAAELGAAARVVHRVLQQDAHTRDFTLTGVRRGLAEIVAHFPAYRTYATRSGPTEKDRATLDWALGAAARSLRPAERPLLEAVGHVVSGAGLRTAPPGARRREGLRAVRRFQQLTAPVAAKAVEDTAFYRYVRLVSRNEVGSDPGRFAVPPAAFQRLQRGLARQPLGLLATATHDHKRGEDTRMRIAVLSERAEEWAATAARWARLNAPLKAALPDGPAPGAADEYQLYQTLVGAWPLGLDPADRDGVGRFAARIEGWLLKALREAKLRTDWGVGDPAYEDAAVRFLHASLAAERPARFAGEVAELAADLAPAGLTKGLAQTALKCWSVGVPDIYQGTEWWDFSLVDPDNRAPVDFVARAAALDGDAEGDGWRRGEVKQQLLRDLLAVRQRLPELFLRGRYLRPRLAGPLARRLVVQMLAAGDRAVLLAVPRLTAGLGMEGFARTTLTLPDGFAAAEAHRLPDGRAVAIRRRVVLAELLHPGLPLVAAELRRLDV